MVNCYSLPCLYPLNFDSGTCCRGLFRFLYKALHCITDLRALAFPVFNTFEIEVKNTREIPVKVEIMRNFSSNTWDIEKSGDFGEFAKIDLDTVKFTLKLNSSETKKFQYVLTIHYGSRADR